ncbi:1-acyl-sn-glycerol-3-phosphate acyltransferase [Candidatus Bipolaricaulota bacterium]|nr:1-acyl-sn-glycerol-3-phosphate acyltransferase [Candidatus Bipolaricaulota bacterium]
MSGQLRIGIRNGLYVAIVLLCYVALKILFRIRVSGRENIKADGEYIAVARHRSFWDALVLAVGLGVFNRIHFIARTGLLRGNPLVQPIIRAFSTIIDRENFGKSDFRRMLVAMKEERLIGLFPEGTTRRSVDAKAGAIHFAQLTGKRILPVNIIATGPYPPQYPFAFPRLRVSIGESFDVSDLSVDESSEQTRAEKYQKMSEQLMLRVDNA